MYYIACQRSTKSTARGLPEVYIACERSEHFRTRVSVAGPSQLSKRQEDNLVSHEHEMGSILVSRHVHDKRAQHCASVQFALLHETSPG